MLSTIPDSNSLKRTKSTAYVEMVGFYETQWFKPVSHNARLFLLFSFLFGSTAGREIIGSTSSEVSNGYSGDIENLSEHDGIVESCFEEPTEKQETTFDAQCQEEPHALLSEGIRTNLLMTLSRCRQIACQICQKTSKSLESTLKSYLKNKSNFRCSMSRES